MFSTTPAGPRARRASGSCPTIRTPPSLRPTWRRRSGVRLGRISRDDVLSRRGRGEAYGLSERCAETDECTNIGCCRTLACSNSCKVSDARPRARELLLNDSNVRRLQSLGTTIDVELYDLPFGECAKAIGLDHALMAEHVFPALLRDKAKALAVVEPLHCSSCHYSFTSFFCDSDSRC